MIYVKWSLLPESEVKSFNLFKSIVGVRLPHKTLSELSGKALTLKVNGGASQTVTFDGTTGTVSKLNSSLTGARAYEATTPGYFYIRSNNRSQTGSIQILPSTAQELWGEIPRLVTEKSESFFIGSVPVNTTGNFEFPDPDGTPHDWYALTTIDPLDYESDKSPFKQAVSYTGDVCILEGCVVDLHGRRLPDVEVRATLVLYPHSSTHTTQVSTEPVTTLSGPDGRFSLTLLQGTTVQLEIPAVGFSRNVDVPEKPYVFVSDLLAELDYRFPLESF